MTDTTDIKALREAMLTKGKSSLKAKEVVTIFSEIDRLSDSVKHLRIEVSASDAAFLEMKKQHSKQFDRCRELSGKLEAERQRSAGSEEELHKALHREKAAERKLLAAQGEIAALKGDQVPVITCYSCRKVMTRDEHAEADGFCPHCDVEIELDEDGELFTAPQKTCISKEKLCDWLEDNFDIDDSQRDAFANCFAHHCNCIVKKEGE